MRGEVDAEDRRLKQEREADEEGEGSTNTQQGDDTGAEQQSSLRYILGSPTKPSLCNPLLIEAKQGLFGVTKYAQAFGHFSSQLPIFLQGEMHRKLGGGVMTPARIAQDTRVSPGYHQDLSAFNINFSFRLGYFSLFDISSTQWTMGVLTRILFGAILAATTKNTLILFLFKLILVIDLLDYTSSLRLQPMDVSGS
jgi:hypothetical protein